ncbi:Sec23-binding domain of Sec16-domain-containing protein [Lineolata rhizophorae]|uniref:Protein transport protein sec16 n=1 Tax=Lineolata rhizophorae TaxID=578093 RepID=A0A6A6PE51_9PEZI|nr:Sec23-binding domain of Sec16-domain-containing protein [Lineolata rhizophorae]
MAPSPHASSADDDAPNFSYAYAGSSGASSPAPTSNPSWNPALRPDHISPPASATFKSGAGSNSKPQRPPAVPFRWSIERPAAPPNHDPPSDDDFFDRYGSNTDLPAFLESKAREQKEKEERLKQQRQQQQQGQAPSRDSPRQEEEKPKMEEPTQGAAPGAGSGALGVPAAAPKVEPESLPPQPPPQTSPEEPSPPEPTPTVVAPETDGEPEAEARSPPPLPPPVPEQPSVTQQRQEEEHEQQQEEGKPAEATYEHQGEATFLEEAVQESAEEPLMQEVKASAKHEEPLPPIEWDDEAGMEGAFGFGGGDAAKEVEAEVPPPPEVTQAKTEQPVESRKDKPTSTPAIDWGTGDDHEDAFNFSTEVLPVNGAPVNGTSKATEQPTEAPATKEHQLKDTDLDALWKEALGDDELLEDDLGEVKEESQQQDQPQSKSEQQATQPEPAFFEDDGEGFLDEDAFAAAVQSNQPIAGDIQTTPVEVPPRSTSTTSTTNKYAPPAAQQAQQQPPARSASIAYAPAGPQFMDLLQQQQRQGVPGVRPSPMPQSPYSAYGTYPQAQQQQRPQHPSAQSFVDKSKGGYHSPYDLPEDLAPKKKPSARVLHGQHFEGPQSQHVHQTPPPPPRTASMSSMSGAAAAPKSVPPPPPARSMSGASMSPPPSSHSNHSEQKPQQERKGSADFFAELPVVSRPRHATPSGRYTPQLQQQQHQQQQHGPPPQGPLHMQRQASLPGAGLHMPERMPVYADQPAAAPIQPSPPQSSAGLPPPPPPAAPSRYSPVPPAAPGASVGHAPPPPANSRYSPAPTAAPPPATAGPPPAAATRYSPAPPMGGPPPAGATNRYSSAPMTHAPPQKTPPPHPPPSTHFAQPFAPRTSSPLAHHSTPHVPQPAEQVVRRASAGSVPDTHAGPHGYARRGTGLHEVMENNEEQQMDVLPEQQRSKPATPPPPSHGGPRPPSELSSPPHKRPSNYAPPPGPPPGGAMADPPVSFEPPRRSRTQSPSATNKYSHPSQSRLLGAPAPPPGQQRPASAHDAVPTPLTKTISMPAGPPQPTAAPLQPQQMPQQGHFPPTAALPPRRRGFSQDLGFIEPDDERAHDPLQRWKGCPIATFGPGGALVTCLPKQIPRYGGGLAAPMLKCGAGEVRIQSMKDVLPPPVLPRRVTAGFPGPLKLGAKGKKKEVLAWLTSAVEEIEREVGEAELHQELPEPALKRAKEKVLLWKVVQVMVENDGVLDGSPAVEEKVRKVVSPYAPATDGTQQRGEDAKFSTAADLASGVPSSSSTGVAIESDPVNPAAVNELRRFLEAGDREKAVWHAVDQRLWAHAMLVASTLPGRDVWKQVVQEFVRQEVKKLGSGAATSPSATKPLAALYEIFAGNWEESIDELVPASARAGFQMVSKAGPGGVPAEDALAGLDKWRETLALVLANRSEGDVAGIAALGRLLAGYARPEAAHVCFLFAVRAGAAVVSGADDPLANIVLLGADHVCNPAAVGQDPESIVLTETFEYALSLAAPSLSGTAGTSTPNAAAAPSAPLPHLQAYKLQRARFLVEHGFGPAAVGYADAVASALKSSTRASPYYTGALLATLDDLAKRLDSGAGNAGGGAITSGLAPSAWISKPSIDKVSGSMWARFNSFVVGDDEDDAAQRQAGGDGGHVGGEGPFGRLAPQGPSADSGAAAGATADLYDAYVGGGGVGTPNSMMSPTGPAYGTPPTAPLHSGGANSRYAPASGSPYMPGHQQHHGQQRPPSQPSPYLPQGQQGAYQPQPAYQPRSSMESTASGSSPYAPYTPSQLSPTSTRQPAAAAAVRGASQNAQPPASMGLYSPPSTGVAAGGSYMPSAPVEEEGMQQQHNSGTEAEVDKVDEHAAPTAANDSAGGGYEPPSYEPPSYEPYQPDPDPPSDEEGSKVANKPEMPKKKSFMDDDEDDDELAARAAALKKAQKEKEDREADDAVRRAAEADAARGAQEKKGWLSGWFKRGGSADGAGLGQQQSGPIRAKLGEENSFVYDPELKKWVNKKAGGSAGAQAGPAATPPPPRGPPGSRPQSSAGPPAAAASAPFMARSTSGASTASAPGAMGPLPPPMRATPSGGRPPTSAPRSGPPSRAGTPARFGGGPESDSEGPVGGAAAPPQPSSGTTPPGAVAGPPSRPPTSMSNASSIDDLLGAPGQRKGAGKKGKRGGRYVDVMAK